MAKLPPIDVQAIWIRDLLHRGRREEALKRIDELIASGRARHEVLALAEQLKGAGRGRQPFGASYLWYDIGRDNEELQAAGKSYAERLDALGAKYMIGERQVKSAVATFRKAEAESQAIDVENDDRI